MGINVGKRQKQKQTFPPQSGSTEQEQEQHRSLQALGQGDRLSVPRLPGVEAPRWERSRAGCGAGGSGKSCIPKTWGREQDARGNTEGLSSNRSPHSPTSPAGSQSLAEKPPPRAAVGWGVCQAQCGAGAGHPCPGTQPSPRSCPQEDMLSRTCRGHTAVPKP